MYLTPEILYGQVIVVSSTEWNRIRNHKDELLFSLGFC
jgi:hypothetical protein